VTADAAIRLNNWRSFYFATMQRDSYAVLRDDDPVPNGTTTLLASRLREAGRVGHDCPPHTWGCPVVMKVDPRSVAWTCSGCGAIATVPVGEPPPPRSGTA
jgi:hypothetical protein